MADTLQQERQKVTFPEIRDTADSYAEMPEAEAAESPAIDIEIEDMVWEVDSEPADDIPVREDHYTSEAYDSYEEAEPEYSAPDYYEPAHEQYEEIPYARKMNKHIFTWVLSCLCGMYGVDRFVRGQIGLGIFKILTFGGFGIWYMADLGIAIYKSYLEDGAELQEDLHFDSYGRYV